MELKQRILMSATQNNRALRLSMKAYVKDRNQYARISRIRSAEMTIIAGLTLAMPKKLEEE